MRSIPKSLTELLAKYVTPALADAGFRPSGPAMYVVGGPPGNQVLVDFKPAGVPRESVGFHLQWAAIPPTSLALHHRERAELSTTWGIVGDRVDAPDEVRDLADPETGLWQFPVDRGLDPSGVALRRLLTTGGLVQHWLDMTDRTRVLRVIESKEYRRGHYGMRIGGPWNHLALFIDDGDWDQLDEMLRQLEQDQRYAGDMWVVWWRRQLTERRS